MKGLYLVTPDWDDTDKLLAAPKLTVPLRLLLPEDTLRVPPFNTTDSAPTVTACKSSTLAVPTVTPPALVPKPLSCVTAKLPAFTVTLPVKLLLPDSVQTLLAVSFSMRPAPLSTPLKAWSTLLLFKNKAPDAMLMSAA